MKKSNFINSIWAVVLCLFFVACEGTFVPDPIDPRLPKYTEEGNSVAGALVNNEIWKSQVSFFIYAYEEPTITISPNDDSITLTFYGSTNNESASIKFELKDLKIEKVEDFIGLKGKKITLDGSKNIGYYTIHARDTYTNNGIGQIYFKHIKLEGEKKLLLSGTFGFTAKNKEGKTKEISFGRFDYMVTNINIFDQKKEEKSKPNQ